MDHISQDSKNILMELESLKSKQCIFKMKEANYIKDKDILEDSIKTLQQDLQEKSEVIRSLRKDLDSQSSNLYRDIATKNEELDKTVLGINDLTKKLTIALETVDYHVKRNETIKSEFEKQKKSYDRESECKSRLVTFLETSHSQKESKIAALTSDIYNLKLTLANIEVQFEKTKNINNDLRNNIEELKLNFSEERQKREQDLQRAKNEITQLQQNGISELHLEKMNPTVAATIKALKSSKGLMDIYSELHGVIGERDHLQLEKDRLLRSKEGLETVLKVKEIEIERLTNESTESMKVTDNLKSRLLCLVSELRASETKKGKMEREVLLAKRKAEISEKEVLLLMGQVRVFLVGVDNVDSIKQEPVDVDSAMYTSVQELQEVNRALRNDNDVLRQRLEESDSEQFKQRCNELQAYSDSLGSEVESLRHENTSSKNLLLMHEKQVQMLRYLLDLKNPGSNSTIEKALRSFEYGIKGGVDVIAGEREVVEEEQLMECDVEINDESYRIAKLENDLLELIDNKRASDQIYIESIETMRADYVNKNRLSIELLGKLEDLKEKFKEERECNEKYRKESELLRAINKNLSQNSGILESQIEELKLKLECKISLLAEKKAEHDSCKSQLTSCRSQQIRMRHERDELKKTLDRQKEILTNISSLQNVANLKDHLCLSNMQHKIQEMETTVEQLNSELNEKNNEILQINDELNESRAELNESVSQLNESRALADAFHESISAVETCDVECQVAFLTVSEPKTEELVLTVDSDQVSDITLTEYKKIICSLEEQLRDIQGTYQSSSDQLVTYAQETLELNQKCEFYESQLNILEKAKQDVLNENIKLTEEAHNLNASLKQDIHRHQDDLSKMRVRLDEAENVERTAQSVIDKYVKECNEAKAKYKRELTLHASDSKLLEALNEEIEYLKSRENDGVERCQEMKDQWTASEKKWQFQVDDMRAQMSDVEQQLREAESRNDRLYQQLTQTSESDSNVLLNEVIEDLRSQINIGKLSDNLLNVVKEKYSNELERLNSEISDLHDQLSMEKDKSNTSLCDSDVSSKNIEAEIVMESNQVLREQKSQLDRLVLNQRVQMDDMTQLLCRLKSDIVELEGQNNSIVTMKAELEEERNRWKDRCTKLIERAEQLDPEKYRVACNDRDRFEKQLVERENSCKEYQNDLNNTKEDIKRLTAAIEDEKNKLKKEEAIGLQLKEIARKYKSEAEKKRQTILELEDSISELNEEKMELLKEKDAAISKLAEIEVGLNSRTKILTEEKEILISRLETLELDLDSNAKVLIDEKRDLTDRLETVESNFNSRMEILEKEKQETISKLTTFEYELDCRTKLIDELTFRCQLLEQDGKEKAMKLQLTERTIVRLKEDNKKLMLGHEEDKPALKRGLAEHLGGEPESKRTKVVSEDVVEDNDESEDEDEEDEESVDKEPVAEISNLVVNPNNSNTTKVWWNVSNNADDNLISQIQKNLEQYKVKTQNDVEMHDNNPNIYSDEESTEDCGNSHGDIMGDKANDDGNIIVENIDKGQEEDQSIEEGNDEFDNDNQYGQEHNIENVEEGNSYCADNMTEYDQGNHEDQYTVERDEYDQEVDGGSEDEDNANQEYKEAHEVCEEVHEEYEEIHEEYEDVLGDYEDGNNDEEVSHVGDMHEEEEEEVVHEEEEVLHEDDDEEVLHEDDDEEVMHEDEEVMNENDENNYNEHYTEEGNDYYHEYQGEEVDDHPDFVKEGLHYQNTNERNTDDEDEESYEQCYPEQDNKQANFSPYMLSLSHAEDNCEDEGSDSSVVIIEDSSDDSDHKTSLVSGSNVSKETEEQGDAQSETLSIDTRDDQTIFSVPVRPESPPQFAHFSQNNNKSESQVTRNEEAGATPRRGGLRKLIRRGGN